MPRCNPAKMMARRRSAAGSVRRTRAYERVENVSALSSAIADLSAKERGLLRMRFGAGMTQLQIGRRLGVSQMQVSRLLRATLERLRLGLSDLGAD